MKKGFIHLAVIFLLGAGIVGLLAFGYGKGLKATGQFGETDFEDFILGVATGSGVFPTSTNNFQDGDTINAGDWNAI